jgi:two-component system NtrC family sensor kinase
LLFEEGRSIGTVAIFRDLRELQKLEQQFDDHTRLLQQDKMISLGRLSASVVHEINNPLSGILNYARLMIKILSRGPLTSDYQNKFQRYLDLIESETHRCSKIVSNLLAFSRKSELKFSEINVNDLLQKCLLLSRHKMELQNIRTELELNGKIPKIWGDFNQIQQAMINLIFNAIDAMPEGGTLTLSSSLHASNRSVKIQVKDTGCGILSESLEKIFDPFYTTKKEGQGMGLGLSTVYGIIDRHKGRIEVSSEPNKGTVFTLLLPSAQKPV